MMQSVKGSAWQPRRRPCARAAADKPVARDDSSDRSVVSPDTVSNTQLPQPPELHSYGKPMPLRSADRKRVSPAAQANGASRPSIQTFLSTLSASNVSALLKTIGEFAIVVLTDSSEARTSAIPEMTKTRSPSFLTRKQSIAFSHGYDTASPVLTSNAPP